MDLLEKASIILTPTAYNNDEALCVKPDDGSGDFDFSRNSAATRVNEQGLVENVQILSNNLVDNGDFSEIGAEEISNGSFSQQGSELVANGSFDTDSNWVKGTGWSISAGTANCDGTQTSSSNLRSQTFVVGPNPRLKLTFDVTNYSAGTLDAGVTGTGRADINNINANGTYSVIVVSSPGYRLVDFVADANFIGSVSNVSVVEVGQDWEFSSGATLTDIGAKITHAPTTGSISQPSVLVLGKQYKFTYEITESVAGSLKLNSAVISSMDTSVGVHTKYFEADLTNFTISRTNGSNNDVTITNISVKEVGQNWTLSSTDISIGENKIVCDNVLQNSGIATQVGVVPIQKQVKLQYDVVVNSGTFRILLGSNGTSTQVTTSGTYTFYETSGTGGNLNLQARTGGFDGSITNISVIEITDDTNLPRINYEGFSYQDALGSEEIVNGGFDDGITGWSTSGSIPATVLNGIATIPNTSYIFQNALADGKQGKIVVSGNGSVRYRIGTNLSYSAQTAMPFTVYGTFGQNARIQIQNSSGTDVTIDNVSVKEYLGQEVVPDSGCGSWLWEPQTTQLIPYSEDFSQSSWNKGSDISIESGYLAPDGNNTAYKVSEIGAATSYLTNNIGLTSTTTRSVYARTISGTGTATLLSHNSNTNNLFTLTEQWQRFELNSTASPSGLSSFYAADFRGSGTLTEYLVWGANATNDQDYATSYIPSNGSSVTRNQDLCTNGGSLASINSTEGTLYAEIAALANDGTDNALSINNGSQTDRIWLGYSTAANRIYALGYTNSVVQFVMFKNLPTDTDMIKVAVKYKENDFALWVNGIEEATATSGLTPIGLNSVDFFINGIGSRKFFGKTKALAVWKEALSDSELQSLTTI